MSNKLGIDLEKWNKTEAIESNDFENLKLGGHKIVIKEASLHEGLVSGTTSLKVCVDIAKGDEQEGFFQKQYDNNKNENKKWSNGATRYLSLKEEYYGYTKGFITALEKSNNNFKFDTNKGWDQLHGLMCAGVFGLEEYENNEGQIRTATKLVQFRSLDKLNEIKIPKVKTIDGTFIDYDTYISNKAKSEVKEFFNTTEIEITDEELPF